MFRHPPGEHQFSHQFVDLIIDRFFILYFPFWLCFSCFSCFLHNFFEYGFYIVCLMIFGWILHGFVMDFVCIFLWLAVCCMSVALRAEGSCLNCCSGGPMAQMCVVLVFVFVFFVFKKTFLNIIITFIVFVNFWKFFIIF